MAVQLVLNPISKFLNLLVNTFVSNTCKATSGGIISVCNREGIPEDTTGVDSITGAWTVDPGGTPITDEGITGTTDVDTDVGITTPINRSEDIYKYYRNIIQRPLMWESPHLWIDHKIYIIAFKAFKVQALTSDFNC